MRQMIKDGQVCPNCGAPVTTEICQFCGASTAIRSKDSDMIYPVIECEEVDVNWQEFCQILVLGLTFIGFIIFALFMFNRSLSTILHFIIFGSIGALFLGFVIKSIYKYMAVVLFGSKITGVVWGYMDNNRQSRVLHGQPGNRIGGQIVKILVNTTKGKRFLLYELRNDEQPYGVNQIINLKKYKNMYIIF